MEQDLNIEYITNCNSTKIEIKTEDPINEINIDVNSYEDESEWKNYATEFETEEVEDQFGANEIEEEIEDPNSDPNSESNFKTNSEPNSHPISESNNKSLGMVQCPICGITFTGTSTTVEMHLKNVHKKFKCEFCDKIFDRKFNLRVHTKTEHSKDKEKTIDCDFCDKSFVRKPKFKKHMMKIHNMSESKFKKFW